MKGLLRQAQFQCPSHAIDIQELPEHTRIQLQDGRGFLDRDLILLMHYGGEKVSAVCAPDGDHYAALASFCTELPEVAGQDAAVSPRIFKILVDCSGSMLGDSIAQARIALLNIIDGLRPMDRFSLIRFGSHIAKDIAAPVAATAANIARAREMLARMDADLGGTEIFAALQETLQMENDERPADLLLITDGEVWDAAGEESRSRAIIDLANATWQRIFSVGVGSSVSERLVRELAEQTGGACELGNPEEGMAEKIERHFKRIHLPRAQSLEIRWPAEPEWQQQLKPLFAGDTLHVFARFPEKPAGSVALQVDFGNGAECRQVVPLQVRSETGGSDILARLAANARMQEQESRDAIVKIASEYQLLSEHTAYLVTEVRPGELKSDGMPDLRKVPVMLASGWGGLGRAGAHEEGVFYSMADTSMHEMACYVKRHWEKADFEEALTWDSDYMAAMQGISGQIMPADALWKCREPVEMKRILKAKSLQDLKAFGVHQQVLEKLQEYRRYISDQVTDQQLIAAFFYLWMLSAKDGVFTGETQKMIRRRRKKQRIDDADL